MRFGPSRPGTYEVVPLRRMRPFPPLRARVEWGSQSETAARSPRMKPESISVGPIETRSTLPRSTAYAFAIESTMISDDVPLSMPIRLPERSDIWARILIGNGAPRRVVVGVLPELPMARLPPTIAADRSPPDGKYLR